MWNSEHIIFPNFTSKYRVKRKRYHQFVFEKPERVKRKIHSRLLSKQKRHRLERERERERERECVCTDLVIDWVSRRENPRAYWRLCWTNCKSSSETSTSSSGISGGSSGGRIIFSLFFLPIAVSLVTAALLWFWGFWLGF